MSEFEEKFVAHLVSLSKPGSAAMAELRRSLSFSPGAYPPSFPYVERFVGAGVHAEDSRRRSLYLTAGLFALHPTTSTVTLAECLATYMASDRGSDSVEQRFIALLGADAENIHEYLRQAVSLLKSAEIGVDYAALLADLRLWMNPQLEPQKLDRLRQRWARDFYSHLPA